MARSRWFLAFLLAVILPGCHTTSSRPKATIGIQASPALALVMVAKDGGWFERAGVDVELRNFTAGKFALQAQLGGSLDFAVAGEVPVTLASMQGNRVTVYTQVVERTVNETRVVARRDGSLESPGEYFRVKRRRLATSFGGGPEFFTYAFLRRYGISNVEVLSMKPEDMPAALISGSIDAISVFDPFAFIAEKRMGAAAITFTAPDVYSELYVLAGKPGEGIARPLLIQGILKGLLDAQRAMRDDPAAAKRIVSRYTQLANDVLDGVWPSFMFGVALNQTLVDYMKAEAEWAVARNYAAAGQAVPDFRKSVIDSGPVTKVAPETVRLP